MSTSHDVSRARHWARPCLSLLIGILLLTQWRCGGDNGPSVATGPGAGGPSGSPSAVAQENALPGTATGWAFDQGRGSTNGEIVGYTDRESYPGGADVRVAVSADPPGSFTWEVFRMGGYRGAGGRLYAEGGPLAALRQPDPTFEPGTGLVTTSWPTTFTISTRHPDGRPWLTGVYLIQFTKEDGWQSYAVFILRDDTRDAEVAVQLPTATWHAYNSYGGESLYVSARGLPGGHARKVSLNRPMNIAFGSGRFLFEEHEGVRWLEDQGYDIEYLASSDVAGAVNRLGNHRLYISLAHDEYTTMAAIDRLDAALTAGTSLAFLTGNTFPWQIRYEDDDRTIVGYKDQAFDDPMRFINPLLVTTNFRFPPVNRPENALLGVMSDGSHNDVPADWVVTNANHWVYAGTGLSDGSRIPGIIFNEWDGFVDNGHNPPGLTILASSVVPNNVRPGSRHEATIYERGRAFVFAAGTIYWNQHLLDQPAVAQITTNLLNRAGARRYQASQP